MKRRVCESCLYFESAGFSKNGWCHHPSRRQNSDIRLMVRANELGCRNGWNADLWVAANTDGTDQRSQPLDAIGSQARAEIEPAQQNDLITSIVAAKTENMSIPNDRPTAAPPPERPAIEEDIFVNQKPSLTWSTPTGPLTTQPATELVQNPKAAILRARDQFRQRRRNEGRLADRQVVPPAAPLIASAREAQLLEDRDLGEPDPRPDTIDPRYENRPLLSKPERQPYDGRKPVKPVSIDELARPFPSMTDFPEDRKRFESVPSLQSSPDDVVELDHVDTVLETRLVDAVPSDPYVVDDLFEEDERLEVDAEEPYESFEDEDADLSVHHRESILNRFLRQRRERRQHTEHYDDGYVEADAAWDEPAQRAYVPEQSVQSHERAHRSDYPQAPDGAGDRPSTGTEHARPAPRPHEPEPASMASGPPMEEYDIAQLDEAFDSRELDRLRYAEPERQAEPTRDHHHVEPSTDRPGESAYDAMEWVEPEYPSFRTRDEIHVRSRTEERIQRPQISRQQDARSTQPANDQTEAFDAPLWETVPTPPRDYRSAYRGEHSHPGNDRIATERSNSRPRNDQPNPQLDWPNTADNIQGPIAHAERRDDGYRSEERSSRAQRPNRAGDIGDILDDEDFQLPPPLPAYQPPPPPAQPYSATRYDRGARNRSEAPEPGHHRRSDIYQPVSDEFGDQALFASAPDPADYEIDPPHIPVERSAPIGLRMERICQTCRDFRPSENGERGWCSNKWAFNHRRMVDADDLACRNSLGSWWTPKDDVWRRDGDISRHAQQTPRVDQWLFGSQNDDENRRKSSS